MLGGWRADVRESIRKFSRTPGLPTGMYLYELSTPEAVLTKRMLLVK